MNRGLALPPHRPLAILAALTGVLAVGLLPAMALDHRQLLGVSVWLKPWKFAVSIAIYSLTVAWMVTLVGKGADTCISPSSSRRSTVASAATASWQRDCRYENPPPSPCSRCAVRLCRLPLPT
jgi:hypothetical protein